MMQGEQVLNALLALAHQLTSAGVDLIQVDLTLPSRTFDALSFHVQKQAAPHIRHLESMRLLNMRVLRGEAS